jgi:hypothetical protein
MHFSNPDGLQASVGIFFKSAEKPENIQCSSIFIYCHELNYIPRKFKRKLKTPPLHPSYHSLIRPTRASKKIKIPFQKQPKKTNANISKTLPFPHSVKGTHKKLENLTR